MGEGGEGDEGSNRGGDGGGGVGAAGSGGGVGAGAGMGRFTSCLAISLRTSAIKSETGGTDAGADGEQTTWVTWPSSRPPRMPTR